MVAARRGRGGSVLRTLGRLLCGGLPLLTSCSSDNEQPVLEVEEKSAALFGGHHRPPDTHTRNYTLFEAGPVRPVAILDSGLIAVTNIPDDRVELFRPKRRGVKHCGSIKVGLRPVALSVVGRDLWVVNHLSDSVSVVSVDERRCRGKVERTLLVGDEPRDVVAARNSGGKTYALVTAAHRGQNVRNADGSFRDPELTTPGVGRADVFVFDANALGAPGGEQPASTLTLFTDSPRALAVGKDKVYAAGFLSGNQTTLLRYQLVIDRGRKSFAQLDSDGDLQIDADIPEEERVIEGGYPAIKGHGRCISANTTTPPSQHRNDFIMDVCVRTDPGEPSRALEIIPQAGGVTPQCSCTNALGELQRTPPMVVRFFESEALCGSDFDASLGGCWLEPPTGNAARGGQAWNQEVLLSLPDRDVFTIDLNASPPALVADGDFRKVGTTLFNMAVHPKNGTVFVSNIEARNLVRFEGPGGGAAQDEAFASTTVRGHIAESRISLLDPTAGSVTPVHLNGHIDFSQCCEEEPNADTERSLAFPLGMEITRKRSWNGKLRDDQDLYVAALGSNKVAVLSTRALQEAGPEGLVQDPGDHIEVPGGPAGLALDERRDRLYVLARFTNELVVIDTDTRATLERAPMFNPEPASVVEGRPFLYDARRTSSHGDSACASCHVFGDFDGLSWDLGAPDEAEFQNLGPFFAIPEITSSPLTSHFLPVKGPMNTQSLRGLANHGSMHWRGDRRGGLNSTEHEHPDTGAFDEDAAFNAFNVAFAGLNGRSDELPEEDMQRFTNFALQITYPPNPIRALDDSLTPAQKRARSRYFGCEIDDESYARDECIDGRSISQETLACNCANPPRFVLGLEPRPDFCPPNPVCTLDVSDFQNTCNGCHTLDPAGNSEFGIDKPGFFGTSGVYTNDAVAHILKVPHLRNMYQKVGMFGSSLTPQGIGLNSLAPSIFGPRKGGLLAQQHAHAGDQIRGFGFTHAGEEDTLFRFFSLNGFARAPAPGGPLINDNRAGFEPVLPEAPQTCFDDQLQALNAQFIDELGAPETVQSLREQLQIIVNPASPPEEVAAASQAVAAFILTLPPSNPGSVFQQLPLQSAIGQLTLPLLACPSVPDYATLEALGCFDISTGAGCASLLGTVRGCSLWGATLEQILPNGTHACQSAGIQDKEDMESLMMAFDSNLKPVVGQQVTLRHGATSAARDRLELLITEAEVGHCDLVAHSRSRGYVYESGRFTRDDGRRFSAIALRHVPWPITYTAVPPGEGRRSGIDRDEDGRLDAFDRHDG